MLDLFKREFDDANWMWTIGEGLDKCGSFSLVSDSIKTNCDVLSMETHQAISVVNDVTSLILSLEGDSFVWESFTVNS